MADADAMDRLRRDFIKSPRDRWATIIFALSSSVLIILLLFLLYLFVDLLVWQGVIPSFVSLPSAQQTAFETEWTSRWPEEQRLEGVKALGLTGPGAERVAGNVDRERPPTLAEWEIKWQTNVYLWLNKRVNSEAADVYRRRILAQGEDAATPPKFGLLSLVIRERQRWPGPILGWLASWNSWTWHPGSQRDANPRYLAGLFGIALVLVLLQGLTMNAANFFAARLTMDSLIRIRRAIYFHTFRLGSLAIRTLGISEPVELITRRVETVGEAIHTGLLANSRSIPLVVLLILVMLLCHFWLALTFLLLGLLVWGITGQIAAYFRQEARYSQRHAQAVLEQLRESLGMIGLVKCYQMERFNQNRVERQLGDSAEAYWRRRRGEALSGPVMLLAAALAAIACFGVAGRAVLAGELSVAGLVLLSAAMAFLVSPLDQWLRSREVMRLGRESADAIFEFLERKGEAAEAADAEFLPALTTRIEFRQVTLQAPGSSRPLLANISFAIPAASRVAIVGPNEEEKRALVYLIPRLLDPTTGEVRIEDKNIRWVTHESLRAQVALVTQSDLIFSDTVYHNIGCGDPSYTLPKVIEAAKLAHAHQFIERLPYGYETLIGDFGHPLRPGERFRIALARAILRDPSILIIEEPDGPMDEDTLALVDDTLDRIAPGRTLIFLAHRSSTLRAADRIFLIRNGQLEASGHHQDLWQESEAYRRLAVMGDAPVEV